jgi:hypothetical protein
MRRPVAAAAALISVCLPIVASAVDFSVDGFSTAGYTTIDNDRAEYAYSTFSEGVTSDGTFDYDSMVGLQGTAKFGDQWSVVAQVLMRKQANGDFGPNVDWAYLKWEPTNDLFVRAGLTRVPTFYYSDSVFLGYATPWVRPPIEVYGLSPVYLLEGMDAVWHTDVGPVSLDVQAFYGQSDLEIYATSKLQPGVPPRGSVDIPMKDWGGLLLTARYGSVTARIGYSDKRMDSEWVVLEPLIAGLNRLGYAELAKQVGFKDAKTPILDAVVHYDNGDEFALLEVVERDSDSIAIPHAIGSYLTAGKRFGSITPYATYARLDVQSKLTNETIQIPAGSPLAPTLRYLDASVDNVAGFVTDQETLSAGFRYDVPSFAVLKGAVVKLQVDRIDPKDGGKGFLSVTEPGFSDVVHMYSLTFDMIF